MSRRLLFIAGFTVSSAALGWGQIATQSTTTTPANGPWGGPLLVTPIADFPTPPPTAGISDAGRAGISISNGENQTTTGPTVSETPATIMVAPVPPAPTQQTSANDVGTSFFVSGAADASGARTTSLAEVSTRYKAEKATRNAQVLDNEDVQRMLDNKSGVTTAKNMPPLGPGATQQPPTQNAAIPSATTQSAQENTRPAQNSAPSQGAAASPVQNQSATPETNAANSTTPEINQNQQSNDTQGSGRLPATATFLPLLGLLGLVSGGIGFWFRKLRN